MMTDLSLPRVPPAVVVLLLVLSLGLTGCTDETLTPPNIQNDLFNSYVALGNSITAGLQSGGINQNTQQAAYPVLLAEQMGTPFDIPALATPGCPPPLAQAFPPETIAPDTDCALRTASAPPGVNNVAVPNAAVIDILSNRLPLANPNPLTQFILGGRTQIEAAREANPTFATVWIGNNDVLGGALQGDTTLATPPDSFRTRYSRMLSRLESIETLEGAVFLGVANVTLIPHFSRGAAYQQAVPAAQDAGNLPPNFNLNKCGPSDAGARRIPFQHGAALVQAASGVQQISDPSPTITLNCSKDRSVEETVRQSLNQQPDAIVDDVVSSIPENIRSISLLTTQEISFFQDRVTTFNEDIQELVADDYGYVDPNDLFRANSDQIPAFPKLFENPNEPFGPLFSLDGIHPSSGAHRLVTNAVISTINNTYDTQLSTVSTP